MTVIAWDGKQLAADKLIILGDTKSTMTKLYTAVMDDGSDAAIAFYGGVSQGLELVRWFVDGADPDDFPISVVEGETGLVVAYSTGECFEYEGNPVALPITDTYHAWGSGAGYAIGAMAAGADAVKAVELTNYHCASCGRGVDVCQLL